MKNIASFFLILSITRFGFAQTNSFPSSGNAKIYAVDAAWAEGLLVIKPSTYGGIRFARTDPSGNNYSGNWALGYTNSGNDLSIVTNYGGTQYDGVFHISNSTRYVGIGTTSPRGKFDVDGAGDIYLSDDVFAGTNQSLFLPGHIYISPYNGGNISYLQARRYDNSGTTSLRFRTYNSGTLTEAMHIEGNGYVGIGTTSPSANLDIQGSGSANVNLKINGRIQSGDAANAGGLYVGTGGMFMGQVNANALGLWNNSAWRLIADNNGNVGIGTISPVTNSRLDVQGGGLNIGGSGYLDATLHIKSSFGGNDRLIQMSPSANNKPALNLMASKDAGGTDQWWSWGVNTSGNLVFQPGINFSGATGLFMDRNGNTGIGTTSPNQKLTVNGTIYGKEVKVDLNVPGPDYVFEKDYKLPSLDEIKSYIDTNKHLPEVPSAKEMEQNGINLSEMNMILLKKVEELTLMMIELKKANQDIAEKHEQQIRSLESEIGLLKNKK